MHLVSSFAHKLMRAGLFGLLIVLLAACGGAGSGIVATTGQFGSTPAQAGSKSTPTVVAGKITKFAIPSSIGGVLNTTAGPVERFQRPYLKTFMHCDRFLQ
jgi:hypothetical protein